MELQLKVIFAGIMFGAWPLIMNRSGLGGHLMLIVLSVIIIAMVLPFLLFESPTLMGVDWKVAVAASVVAGMGMLGFSDVLAKASPREIGLLYMLLLLAQFAFPVVYHVLHQWWVGDTITLKQAAGITTAVLAALLLAWPEHTPTRTEP